MKAVIYARYSGDRQRETSIDDQVRNCTRFAESERLTVEHIYHDRAMSGAVRTRPDYQQMLADADTGAFDVLAVDDLSRLSRDDYEMKGVLRQLTWRGVRVVGVTDGYDSARKGHKIHAGFKGLMNEMFLDDLRERTHRGMTGQALKGYNCGGRTYGYRNVPIEDETRQDAYGRPAVIAVQYEIDETQAAIVRQIHAWYAAGYSYKWIASELNRRRVRSSRGTSWALTAVKVILENEMYEGRLIWNRRAWMKHPETGKRTSKKRPRSEWIVSDRPELRIVPRDVIESVRHRQRRNQETYRNPFSESSAQRYLFSGLMVCAECGGNFVIVASHRYGCAAHKTRGPDVCRNGVTVSRYIVEERILESIKSQLLQPGNMAKFKRAAVSIIERHNASDRTQELKQQLRAAEQVRDNILNAIKQGVVTAGTRAALQESEDEIANATDELSRVEQWRVSGILPRAIERYQQAVAQLEETLTGHVEAAREILKSLLGDSIRIHRKGEYLHAEIPNHVQALLAKSLNSQFDSLGCGGAICTESNFVCLKPGHQDSVPLKLRSRRRSQTKQSA